MHPEVEALALPQLSHKFKLSWTLQLFSQATAFPTSAALAGLRESDFLLNCKHCPPYSGPLQKGAATGFATLPAALQAAAFIPLDWLPRRSQAWSLRSVLHSYPFLALFSARLLFLDLVLPTDPLLFLSCLPLPSLVLCLST